MLTIVTGPADKGTGMTTLTPLVLRYVGGRQNTGDISRLTARNIRNHLMSFALSFGNRPVEQLGHRAVERWVAEMEAGGLAKSTQASRLSSLRCFARWCVLNGEVVKDWTLGAPKIRRPRRVPRDMTADHFAAMLPWCHTPRERLIVWLMFGCGLRCVEVHRLDLEDLDPITGMLHITGKARHERHVPVPDQVAAAWCAYLDDAGHGAGALIRSEIDGARRLGPERISGIVRRITADAGIKVRRFDGRGAHGLRACAASDLYDACGDPHIVQAFLGHASMATTSIYMRRASLGKMAEAQRQRTWPTAA